MAHWTNLPAEIHMMILGIVVEDYKFESDRYARAGYASVCREWQSVFEQENFRRIIVDQERIVDFEKLMGNEATRYRQGYLEHLMLCIKLDEYDCTASQLKEDDETIRKNNNVFFNSLWDLLFILSKWVGFVGTRREDGLTLELGAYSPSDYYERLLLHGIPSTLRELYIFENFNKVLHPEHFKQLTNLEEYTKRANPSLGKALSMSSRLLTMLSAAFIVDAVDFFASFKPTNKPNSNVIPWENLQYLALTSQLLHPRKADRHINGMLIAAGRAAAFMPKPRGMEIWNGGGGHACVFRYRNYDGKTYISWECTWGPKFKLDPDVIDCWANVPRQGQYRHGNFTVTVNTKLLRHRDTKTYGSIVPLLKQRSWMQHFISDFQMLSRKIRTQHLRHQHNIE
ncbi:hypothetical protein V501_06264 [Pseudogymnoascus sp. VKM F-4519 (FW-2642)]|nr:hypothetical protein V501_06264 [Pseudogymnoascus sp. VKM F-4519 (FW-2642)]